MNWSNTELDHVEPICMFNISNGEELRECFNWKNTQPLLKKFINRRGEILISWIINYNSSKNIRFLKINEEGSSEDFY